MTLLVLLPGVVASGQVAKAGGSYSMRLKLKQGQVLSYTVDSSTGAAGQTQHFTMVRKWTVISATASDYTLREELLDVKLNGQSTSLGNKGSNLQINAYGETVSSAASPVSLGSPFPKRPVRLGEQWSMAITQVGLRGVMSYKLTGFKNLRGRHAAVIKERFTSKAASVDGQGELLVDIADGTILQSSLSLKVNYGNDTSVSRIVMKRV
ncbi:MAG: hypothetical protein JSS72_10465 [Armatimonadetes bacterium]|nr:hypothetical protein [Armatimonadota bacterium]